MIRILFTAAIVAGFSLAACSHNTGERFGHSDNRWEGFIYPNKKDQAYDDIGSYGSLEGCRASALEALSKIGSVEAGRYECALNCEGRADPGQPRICEKDRDRASKLCSA
jgi:hypothetical protein